MPKQRKIKHYNHGYLNRRRRRSGALRIFLFLLLLAALIFIGYCVTKAVGDLLQKRAENSQPSTTSQGESLPPSAPPESEPDLSSSEPALAAPAPIRAIAIPKTSMTSLEAVDAFLDTVDKALYNSVVAELKNPTGMLFYASEVELAATCKAISPTPLDLKELASRISAKGFTPLARIYTLQDDLASHTAYSTSYLYKEQASVTWLDQAAANGGKSWLNPYMANAVDYLASLSDEISAAGFQTIFAYGVQYPGTKYAADMGFGPTKSSMTTLQALQNVLDQMQTKAAKNGGTIIPVFQGNGYLEDVNSLYSSSANAFHADKTSPLLPADKETDILAAVTAPLDQLVPALESADQIPALQKAGIQQYLVG